MLRRIFIFLFKDFVSAFRDKIPLYLILFPLIVAGIMKLFLPSLESGVITFVIDKNSVENIIIYRLDDFAEIEYQEGKEKVIKRVEDFDDVIGIVKENGKYNAILEGNETGEIKEITEMILDSVLKEKDAIEFIRESLNNTNSFIAEYFISMLILASILMSGLVYGLRMVDEKETKTISALAVSPLRMIDYIISISIFTLIMSIFLSIASTFILLGAKVNYLELLIGIVVSLPVGILSTFIVGGFSSTQITAIAIIKVYNVVYNAIPIAAIFIPIKWQWFFYPFPNYWMFQVFKNVFNITSPQPPVIGFWLSVIITLASGLIYLFILIPLIKQKIKLR